MLILKCCLIDNGGLLSIHIKWNELSIVVWPKRERIDDCIKHFICIHIFKLKGSSHTSREPLHNWTALIEKIITSEKYLWVITYNSGTFSYFLMSWSLIWSDDPFTFDEFKSFFFWNIISGYSNAICVEKLIQAIVLIHGDVSIWMKIWSWGGNGKEVTWLLHVS